MSQRIWEKCDDRFVEFSAYKAATHNSKAIILVMTSVEKFLFSFGLAKLANSNNARRAFNVLEFSDTVTINFCI